jgi:hypothetical protein
LEEPDNGRFDGHARCCLDEKVRQLAIVRVDNFASIDPVVVESPSSEQQSGSLVAFGEPLGSRNAVGKHGCRLKRVVNVVDRLQCVLYRGRQAPRTSRPMLELFY